MATAKHTMRLIPVPQSRLAILAPLMADRIVEAKLSDRITVEEANASLLEGYTTHSKAAYVDSIEDPKHCVIMGCYKAILTRGNMASVHLIYSKPEHRDNPEALAAMKGTIEGYASLVGASVIVVSDWIYKDSPSTSSLWKRWGFEAEQTLFIKLLNT